MDIDIEDDEEKVLVLQKHCFELHMVKKLPVVALSENHPAKIKSTYLGIKKINQRESIEFLQRQLADWAEYGQFFEFSLLNFGLKL